MRAVRSDRERAFVGVFTRSPVGLGNGTSGGAKTARRRTPLAAFTRRVSPTEGNESVIRDDKDMIQDERDIERAQIVVPGAAPRSAGGRGEWVHRGEAVGMDSGNRGSPTWMHGATVGRYWRQHARNVFAWQAIDIVGGGACASGRQCHGRLRGYPDVAALVGISVSNAIIAKTAWRSPKAGVPRYRMRFTITVA